MDLSKNSVIKDKTNEKNIKKERLISLEFIKEKLTESAIKKMFALLVLVGLLWLLQPFKNLLLLTFIITFIFNKIQNGIYDFIKDKIKISVNKKMITAFIFIVLIGIISIGLVKYIPKLSSELIRIKDIIFNIISSSTNPEVQKYSQQVLNLDYVKYLQENSEATLKTLSIVQEGTVTFFLSLILSLFFLLEEKSIKQLGYKLSNSKLRFLYQYYCELGKKFINSFGKVIQVQLIIALINSGLSMVGLIILGFPEPIALGFMILILSLIPVLGVAMSLIPLCLIAFKIGGINKIIAVLVLIVILHALESYVISPKLMSQKSHLPIFVTFLALVIGEHLFGIWGLLLTIPLIMFFMEVFEIK